MPEQLRQQILAKSLAAQIIAHLNFNDPRGRRTPAPTLVGHLPKQPLGSGLTGGFVVQPELKRLERAEHALAPPGPQPGLRQGLRFVLLAQRPEPGIHDCMMCVEPPSEDENPAVRIVAAGTKEWVGIRVTAQEPG